jgi:hypothetical protein
MSGPLAFTLAGTLFSDGSGSAPVPGATVVITDSGGGRVDLVTHENGNFYTASTIEFPVTVDASKCPDHASMLSPVTLGGCNSCHGSSFRIHIP